MIFKKFERSKLVQLRFKNVIKEIMNLLGLVYHRIYHRKFHSNEGKSNAVGRPFNADSNNAFNKLCLWLQSEAVTDQLRLDELQEKMETFPESNEAYSIRWLKKKLKDGWSDRLYFAEINGRKNVLWSKNMANIIISKT